MNRPNVRYPVWLGFALVLVGGLLLLLRDENPLPKPPAFGSGGEAGPSAELDSPAAGRRSGAEKGAVASVPFDLEAAERTRFGDLHVPEYGPRLERPSRIVRFAVVDARGRKLQSKGWDKVRVAAWALHGEYGKRVSARFDARSSVLTVGAPDAGLGPGEHELRLSLGSYGKIAHRWTPSVEDEPQPLKMPGYRRVVTLSFVDPGGEPIPFITQPPQFISAKSKSAGYMRSAPSILRDPPGRIYSSMEGLGGSSSYRSRSRWRNTRRPTDEGRYSIEVIAGEVGEIQMGLDQRLFEGGTVKLRSDFTGGEWFARQVVLKPKADYAQLIEKRRTSHADDPGRRSRLLAPSSDPVQPAPALVEPGNPFDLSSLRKDRYRVLVRGAWSGDLRLALLSDRYDPQEFTAWPGNIHTADQRVRFATWVTATDGMLFHSPPIEVAAEAGELVEVSVTDNPLPTRLSVRTSPTIAAWARAVGFALYSRSSQRSEVVRTLRCAERDGQFHHYQSNLSSSMRAQLSDADSKPWLRLLFASKPAAGFRLHKTRLSVNGPQLSDWFVLSQAEREALLAGALSLEFPSARSKRSTSSVLAFRAVDALDRGLPWVSAAVHPAELDELAQAVRSREASWNEASMRPKTYTFQDEEAHVLHEQGEMPQSPGILRDGVDFHRTPDYSQEVFDPKREFPGRAAMAASLGEEQIAGLDEQQLRMLWSQGAWYDSRRKTWTDGDGYVVTTACRIQPGKTYVLYLWSQSRDDLKPDRRIVFRAQPGTTDLGAIELPSY